MDLKFLLLVHFRVCSVFLSRLFLCVCVFMVVHHSCVCSLLPTPPSATVDLCIQALIVPVTQISNLDSRFFCGRLHPSEKDKEGKPSNYSRGCGCVHCYFYQTSTECTNAAQHHTPHLMLEHSSKHPAETWKKN